MLSEVFGVVSASDFLSAFAQRDCKEQPFACERTDVGDLSRKTHHHALTQESFFCSFTYQTHLAFPLIMTPEGEKPFTSHQRGPAWNVQLCHIKTFQSKLLVSTSLCHTGGHNNALCLILKTTLRKLRKSLKKSCGAEIQCKSKGVPGCEPIENKLIFF